MPDGFNSLGTDDWVAPRLSNLGVNDWTSPAPPPPPPPAPEPPPPRPSSLLGGVGKAIAQFPTDTAGGLTKAFGDVVTAAGTGIESTARNAEDFTRQQVGIINRIDAGGSVAAADDPLGYADASAQQRADIRQSLERDIKASPAPRDTGLGQAGEAVKGVGTAIMGAGQGITDYGEAAFPLTDEEKQRKSVIGVKLFSGLIPYLGAAVVGGIPAVVGLAGVQGFGAHYDAAKEAGASDEDAAIAGSFGGLVNAGLMTVPIGKAMEAAAQVPKAFKGEFLKTVWKMAESGVTLTAFSQLQTVADNVVAGQTYDPTRAPSKGIGENLGVQFAVGAILPGAATGLNAAGRLAGRALPERPTVQPRPVVRDVLDAPDLDTAIDAAQQVATTTTPGTPVDVSLETSALATGDSRDLQQAALLKLFDHTNAGTVEQDENGGYHYRTTDASGAEITHPIEIYHPSDTPEPGAVSAETADALRTHYGQAGVDVVFYKDHPGIPFDGAQDPSQPDTIFLSSDPARNVAQVATHEFTHVLQATTLPDGSSLAELLNQQVAAGITPAGQRYAQKLFGSTAPDRAGFADDATHAAAVQAHLINELGTDIGGEAPKFQSFLPRVIDAIQTRFGDSVASDVLGKLIAGLKSAMETVRGLFGEGGTRSQHWVTNIGEIHDTLAQMYASRFGTPVEREQAALAAMRDKAERDRFVTTAADEAGTQPVPKPEAVSEYRDAASQLPSQFPPAADEATKPGPDYVAIHNASTADALKLRRWLDQLAAERDAQAASTPQAKLLTQTEAAILRPVEGDATKLAEPAQTRLEEVRQKIDAVMRPQADTPAMAKVRDELAATQQASASPVESKPAVLATEVLGDFAGQYVDAVRALHGHQGGIAERALSHPGIGPIDLIWGEAGTRRSDGFGLAKLLAWHPEVVADLPQRLETMQVESRSANRIRLRGQDGRAVVRLDWDGQNRHWLLTAFDENAPRRTERSTDSLDDVLAGRLTPRPNRDIENVRPDTPESKPSAEPAPSQSVVPPPPAHPEPIPPSPDARAANADHALAESIARRLEQPMAEGIIPLSARELQLLAESTYGGTLASGAYSRDRLYDALELGVNRFIQRHPERFNPTVDAPQAEQAARELAALKDSLPTQTVRAGEKDAYQQFSTPPDYAYAANWVANLRPTDHVLEPSAGVGGLIVHAMNAGVRETTVNELSDKRRGMIAALAPTRTTGEDAAQLHNILPSDVRPTVVVMNPPFSRAAERMGGRMVLDEGAKHIEQALSRLEPGGRLVAIVGEGMRPEGTPSQGTRGGGTGKTFTPWWAKIAATYDVRANVGVDRDIYTKYGTSFPTRLLVIDKNPPSGRPMVTGQAHDAAGLIERLQGVRDERSTDESVADQPGGAEVAAGGEGVAGPDGELHSPTGGVGAGEGRGGDTAAGVPEPADAGQPGVNGGDPGGSGPAAGEPVVPVQSQSRRGRAGRQPRNAASGSDEPIGSGNGGGGDGVRPDGSGERDEPGLTPAPESVLATENAVAAPDTQAVSEAVYETYTPQRVQITGAKKHPGALVQSAAMASVMPPATDYKPRIPAALVKSGALSDAQLEAIVYAGHAHSDVMADGKRRGFLIGDGTGVGKGREIAGIILDNLQNGRGKAVWVSEKRALVNDAKRDWNGMGRPASDIIDHGKMKPGEDIKASKGILFTSYDTLKSAEQTKTVDGKIRGKERVDQIIEWLGKDFDGVIAFDEAHNMGNATDTKGGRGIKKAAQKALAGMRLQEELPNARVVYVSATGATEVSNLAYMTRLGLWGEGTAFANRNDFMGQVSSGGIAGMELVARDMKALGHYIARSLSYDGVDYDRVEHILNPDQRATYDKLAEGWQLVLQHFNAALEETGATEDGKTKSAKAKSAAMSAFWGGHQRFFNQIITSMQMPSVLRGVEADLKAGRQAVLQLVNTMEAAQERGLEKARASGDGEIEDLDMTPRDQLMQLIEKSYPVQQMEDFVDDNGNIRSRPATDSKGNPVINQELVARRDRLLDEIGSIRVPDGPLEMLFNHFGTDKVAEVTGRKQRVIRKLDESGQMKTVVEPRGASANVAEASSFQAGKKPILVFSEAGGTGRSYHAENGSGSEDARRSHYLVQGGWRADKAVQGFGRTHRTNQASAPIFHLVTTDLQGQKRFISSIARRLSQLGALTKGERRAADQGMFGMRDNLESTEAGDGLTQFFKDVNRGEVEGVTMDDLEKGMGLKMRDENGAPAKELPKMATFLNRVLSLTVDRQNHVFQAFSDRMDLAIARASAAGTLDTGVETYKADKISKLSEQTVYTDPRSGAETKHVHLNAQNRNQPISFDETLAGRNKTNGAKPDTFIQNNRSGGVFAVTTAGNYTDADGRIIPQARLTSPTDYQFIDRAKVDRDNWKRLTAEQARPLWDQQVAATPEFRNSALHIITGAVLPIWDRLGGSPKIFRLQTDQGERMLGRVIPAARVDATLKSLGAEGIKVTASPADVAQQVLHGATARLANEWTIKRSLVAGEPRIELVGPDYRYADELGRSGVFSERIAYQTRFFIPTEPAAAAAAIEGITKSRPITALEGGTQFSPRGPVQFSPRPVAEVRGDELGGEDVSPGYRRTRGREALLAVMKQGPVENPQLGTIRFSGASVGRTLKYFDSAKLALIPHLREIIAAGELVDTMRSYKPDANVKAYHNLLAPVRVGGVDYDARVVIREDNNGRFYYDFDKSETPPVTRGVSPGRDQTLTAPAGQETPADNVGSGQDGVNIELDEGGVTPRSDNKKDVQLSPRQQVAVRSERETERWTPSELEAYSHVGRVVAVPTWRERLASLTDDLGRRFIRAAVDPYIGVKADDPAGYMALRNANTTAGATEMFLTDGTLKFNGSTYAMADRNGGVEHSLVRPLHGEQDRFLWWVAANRAERLTAEDRENLWSQDDIDTIKATNQGQVPFDYTLPNGQVTRSREAIYLDSLRKLDGFNKNVLDLAVTSGLLNADKVSALFSNPFYVPFYRIADEDGRFAGPSLTSGFVKQNAFKTLKGGTQALRNDLWDNAIKNWSHMIDASLRNRAASGVLDTAVTNGAATELSERDRLAMTKAERKQSVWVMNDGRQQHFRIDDKMIYTAITALDFSGFRNPVMDAATKFKTVLTQGVTADPRFMLRVSIRDAEQAIATAPMSYNLVKNVKTGFGMADLPGAIANVGRAVAGQQLERLKLGDEAANAIAGGGTMRLGSGHDTGGRTTDLNTMLDRPDTINAFWHRISQIGRAYKEVTAQGEDTQRFALYHTLIGQGVPHDQAAYAARDLEDFTLKGASGIARFLTQTVPFMNAWAQGLYKVGRAASDQDRSLAGAVAGKLAASTTKRVAIVLGTTALMTLALDAIYADDEDYKKRTEYDRNANFWFKFGNTQFRIPMGFEVAAIGRIAANGVEALFGANEMTGRRFANSVLQIIGTNMSLNPTPQIVAPLLDLAMNQSGTGAPIVPLGMDKLRSEEQYTPSTTLPARWASSAGSAAARAIGGPQAQFLAPIQIDYLTNAYFGWLGSHVINLADMTVRGLDQAQASVRGGPSMEPVRPSVDLWNFMLGGMVSTQTTPQSRYVDLLYRQAEGIRRAYATYHDLIARGHADDARDFYAANKDQIAKFGLIEKVTQVEATANHQIKRIGESTRLSAEQKQLDIMKYNAMRNRAAENVFGTRPQ